MTAIFKNVKREIVIRTTLERAWKALTEPQERNRWETRHCEIDLKVGGQVALDYGWGVSYIGTIEELIPNRRLTLRGEDNELTIWTMEPHLDGTLVGIEYTGLWSNEQEYMMMDNMAFGTYRFMRNMKSVLEDEADMRSTFWSSWIGMNHYTYRGDSLEGVKVVEVLPGTSADGSLEAGDIITGADGQVIRSYDELEDKVTSMEPGEKFEIGFVRGGEPLSVTLTVLPYGQRNVTQA
ncbi:SRPBCC domain-containing protein [Paenibacillus sp. Cedars]|uniref:SRPBCC family protein n=1 Tax=Paenibacillus sp. Cedars TaxID=1980674 RepID=UPI001164709E|nr:SRPBCC domain-containing protein [Paenibacillus sp. Cedars]AWP25502.1 hypothetical protein B9D94_02105 [Paenibacillus sp. Cedars]